MRGSMSPRARSSCRIFGEPPLFGGICLNWFNAPSGTTCMIRLAFRLQTQKHPVHPIVLFLLECKQCQPTTTDVIVRASRTNPLAQSRRKRVCLRLRADELAWEGADQRESVHVCRDERCGSGVDEPGQRGEGLVPRKRWVGEKITFVFFSFFLLRAKMSHWLAECDVSATWHRPLCYRHPSQDIFFDFLIALFSLNLVKLYINMN